MVPDKTVTTHGCATREEYEEYVRSVEAFIKPSTGIKADIVEKFEQHLTELIRDKPFEEHGMSFFEIAKKFYWAGYNDGDRHGFTMGRRNGQ
jgi:hypothetical protein